MASGAAEKLRSLFLNASSSNPVLVAAPMVRYSKAAFRMTVAKYGADVTYTPMIVSQSFVRSEKARKADFDVLAEESKLNVPVVVQFSASNPEDFAAATAIVARSVEQTGGAVAGVELNCGCPQKNHTKRGVGAALLKHPDRLQAILEAGVAAAKQVAEEMGSSTPLSVAAKIRIGHSEQETRAIVNAVEASGADRLTVHARTSSQRSSVTPNYASVAEIVKYCKLPVIFNGSTDSQDNIQLALNETNAVGVMTARGLLSNPALFAGHDSVPKEAVSYLVATAARTGLPYRLIKQHVFYMLYNQMAPRERPALQAIPDLVSLIVWLEARGIPVA